MLWHWFPSLLIQKTIPPHRWEDYYRVVLHHTRCLLHTIAWWTCETRRWYKLISLKLNLFGKKRKYNRGSGNQKFLVFGMVERGTKKWFYNWSIKGIQLSPYQSLINMLKRGLLFILISLHTSHLQTKATAILPSTTIEGLWSLAKLKIKKWRVFYQANCNASSTNSCIAIDMDTRMAMFTGDYYMTLDTWRWLSCRRTLFSDCIIHKFNCTENFFNE